MTKRPSKQTLLNWVPGKRVLPAFGLDDGASSLALSTAFSPIRDRIRSARGDREWESMLDSL